MELKKIKIKNFKGIKCVEIDISKGYIFPIVGINESGKTSFLEAINFISNHKALIKNQLLFIPSNLKHNFNDSIEVKYEFKLDDNDIKQICDIYLIPGGYKCNNKDSLEAGYTIDYKFNESQLVDQNHSWNLTLDITKGKSKVKLNLYKENNDLWISIVSYLKDVLQEKIIFLPSNIHDVLEKYNIDVKSHGDYPLKDNQFLEGINQLYKSSANNNNDIWDGFSNKKENNEKNYKEIMKSCLTKMKGKFTESFIEEWNSLSGKNQINTKIDFEFELNEDDSISIIIVQNGNRENLSQRSLGFRWLFSFVLITKFYINKKIFFIFDEPAANLHATAQKMLLNVFIDIKNKGNKIIYTTHSPYLISPNFLENTYIIKKSSTTTNNDESSDVFGIQNDDSTPEIYITSYKKEIENDSPNTSYYQAIIDALELSPSMINFNDNFNIILEGKSDSIFLSYFHKFLEIEENYNFIPCKNANSTSSVIALVMGISAKFITVYDNDEEGNKYKNDNNKSFDIESCFTLNELIKDENIKDIESTISKQFRNKNKLIKKGSINSFVKEQFLKENYSVEWDQETLNNFKKLFKELKERNNEVH